jgi:rhamnulose-1-phosphate aldolase
MIANKSLQAEIDKIAEVAGYLWEKGWAERNGGNISVNLSRFLSEPEMNCSKASDAIPLLEPVSNLAGDCFYVTGTGMRMRNVARKPYENGSIIRLTPDGAAYEIITEPAVKPTSELPSHLLIHSYLRKAARNGRVVLHTHPTDLIGLTHCKPFLDSGHFTRTLWSMIPESRIIVPKGIGIVPYRIPGSIALAHATIEMLEKHDIVCWEKHGILATGEDVLECFDAIDTLSKSAQIYLNARMAGFEPEGMTDEQLDDLAAAFNLQT